MKYVFRKLNICFFNNLLSEKEFQSDPQRLHSAVSHILSSICRRIFFRQRGKSTHLYVRNIDSPENDEVKTLTVKNINGTKDQQIKQQMGQIVKRA